MSSFWTGTGTGLLLFASSCVTASVETTHLNAPPRALVARSAQSVEVYASSPPTRPHVDVALLRADQADFGVDTPRMVQSLAERAGELGCDALFVSGATERPGIPGDLYFLDPGSHALFGVCIAYLPQAAAGSPATPTAASAARNAIVLVPPQEQKPKPNATVDDVAFGMPLR